MPVATEALPTGTWTLDKVHSSAGFAVKHMVVSTFRGRFEDFDATLEVSESGEAKLVGVVRTDSIVVKDENLAAHLKTADFFDVENHPQMTFRSTAVATDGADWSIEGELTVKGRTRPVTLALELNGFGPDAYGGTRAGFSAKTEISRSQFGVDIQMPMDGGGVVVGDKISVELEIEAVLRTA